MPANAAQAAASDDYQERLKEAGRQSRGGRAQGTGSIFILGTPVGWVRIEPCAFNAFQSLDRLPRDNPVPIVGKPFHLFEFPRIINSLIETRLNFLAHLDILDERFRLVRVYLRLPEQF